MPAKVKEKPQKSIKKVGKKNSEMSVQKQTAKEKKPQLQKQKRVTMSSLATALKKLEKENSRLAKDLIDKKEKRLTIAPLNPEESRYALARLNLKMTETESLMENQKRDLTRMKGYIHSHEELMQNINERMLHIETSIGKAVYNPAQAKAQLEGFLMELSKLRSMREKIQKHMAG